MATTGANFFLHTNAELAGTTVGAAAAVTALDGPAARQLELGGAGVRIDAAGDLSTASFALNGGARFALVGTTPKNIDLTNLATLSASSAGDLVFTKLMRIVFYNDGAADVTVAPAASNPAPLGLAGTTPTLNIPTLKAVVINYLTAGGTVDATHKIITMTPTAGGSLCVAVGGA